MEHGYLPPSFLLATYCTTCCIWVGNVTMIFMKWQLMTSWKTDLELLSVCGKKWEVLTVRKQCPPVLVIIQPSIRQWSLATRDKCALQVCLGIFYSGFPDRAGAFKRCSVNSNSPITGGRASLKGRGLYGSPPGGQDKDGGRLKLSSSSLFQPPEPRSANQPTDAQEGSVMTWVIIAEINLQ